MADATEDLITQPQLFGDRNDHSTAAPLSDSEDDDLPPDFLNLTRTTKDKKSKTGAPPKRGTKDFEENKTRLQSRTLEASREAMWDALGVVRVHHPTTFKTEKRKIKKTPKRRKAQKESGLQTPEATPEPGVPLDASDEEQEETFSTTATGGTPVGIYDADTGLTRISAQHRRGKIFDTIGRDLSGGGVSLYPEEALWALEGSKLDVRYPPSYFYDNDSNDDEEDDDDEIKLPHYSHSSTHENNCHSDPQQLHQEEDANVPLSLQAAYALYIGAEVQRNGHLTLEKYTVYAALRRLGYIVQRSLEWDGGGPSLAALAEPCTPRSLSRRGTARKNLGGNDSDDNSPDSSPSMTLYQKLHNLLFSSTLLTSTEITSAREKRQASGPLVTPGLYRSYADIFRLLQLVSSNDPTSTPAPVPPRIVVSHHRDTMDSVVSLGGGSPQNGRLPSLTPTFSNGNANGSTARSGRRGSQAHLLLDTDTNTNTDTDSITQSRRSSGIFTTGNGTPVAEEALHFEDAEAFRTCWDVWRPAGAGANDVSASKADNGGASGGKGTAWKKTQPGIPSFRICVVSARDTHLPTLTRMESLFGEQPLSLSTGTPSSTEHIGAVYNRLKHGCKSVILAIVDEGIVSYVRLADAGFSREKLYERAEFEGQGMRGGKGGGRGRGGRGGRSGRGRGGRG